MFLGIGEAGTHLSVWKRTPPSPLPNRAIPIQFFISGKTKFTRILFREAAKKDLPPPPHLKKIAKRQHNLTIFWYFVLISSVEISIIHDWEQNEIKSSMKSSFSTKQNFFLRLPLPALKCQFWYRVPWAGPEVCRWCSSLPLSKLHSIAMLTGRNPRV